MSVPMVKKCCFRASLHTGTIIIAYIFTVWSLLELLGYTLLVTLAPIGRNGTISGHKYALYITAAVVSGVTLLCSILLIVAAHKKLAFLTLPWTIVTGILTAVFFTMCLTGISLILQDEGEMLEVEVIVIVVHLLRALNKVPKAWKKDQSIWTTKYEWSASISVYCILVVHSRHKQIMYEEDERRFQRSGRVYKPVRTKEQAF